MAIKFDNSFCAMRFFLWKAWKFFLRNDSVLLSQKIYILFTQWKFFLRNETFDSQILYSFCAMTQNVIRITKLYPLILHRNNFKCQSPHLRQNSHIYWFISISVQKSFCSNFSFYSVIKRILHSKINPWPRVSASGHPPKILNFSICLHFSAERDIARSATSLLSLHSTKLNS